MRTIFVDYRISEEEFENLNYYNLRIIKCPKNNNVYEAISGHPDIQLHLVDKKTVVVHKNMEIDFIKELESYGYYVICTENVLNEKYPKDIILNALTIDNYFIHNLIYTDPILLALIKRRKLHLLNVNQGYTKCSSAIINSKAVITSDKGIANILIENAFDVLLLPPGDIELPGLNYGFIGGTCGLISNSKIAFYGNLEKYLYEYQVKDFLYKHEVEAVYLSKGKLVDRGSILAK